MKTTRDLNKNPYNQEDINILNRLILKEKDISRKILLQGKLLKVQKALSPKKKYIVVTIGNQKS